MGRAGMVSKVASTKSAATLNPGYHRYARGRTGWRPGERSRRGLTTGASAEAAGEVGVSTKGLICIAKMSPPCRELNERTIAGRPADVVLIAGRPARAAQPSVRPNSV